MPAPSSSGTSPVTSETCTGTVVRSTGSWYDVQVDDRLIPCKVPGRFRLTETGTTNPVIVGDRVTLRVLEDETGLITEIHERTNKLSRRAAGRRVGLEHVIAVNVDAAWVVQSIRQPKLNPGFIDRFLVMAEMNGLPAGLVFNKVDLLRPGDREAVHYWRDLYAQQGYPVLMTSALTGAGVSDVEACLKDKTSVIVGPSGTGKSSLLNALVPGLGLKTGVVSRKTLKGRHTTTVATLLPLPFGGFVVDTPGLREFGIIDLEPAMLSHYFVDFRPYLNDCHYPNCTHDHEPDCVVRDAVEAGYISEERYYSYLNILSSLHLGDKDVGR